MANLNIAERRLPQDGRIMTVVDGPPGGHARFHPAHAIWRERGAPRARPFHRSTSTLDEPRACRQFLYDYIQETIHKPNGIFIVTGPTGAGKTTTLYAALKEINTIDAKLLTAEDPVEYDIDGIMQVPDQRGGRHDVRARSFAPSCGRTRTASWSGEMRDKETAQIAIQASLTGHLVLCTLHTNDSAGAVTRLIDMGVEPFLVAATLEGVLAQRLVRTICKECKSPYDAEPRSCSTSSASRHSDIGNKHFFTGGGCDTCGGSGYRGRKGLYELLDINDPLRELITQKAPTARDPAKGHRTGHGHPARGRTAQHLRRRHHHRRSPQIHLKPQRKTFAVKMTRFHSGQASRQNR